MNTTATSGEKVVGSSGGLASSEDAVSARLVQRSVSGRSDRATSEVTQIVDAAFEVIALSQTPEPSLREVLRRARLSTTTFYRHFRSWDELLLVVLDEGSFILASYLSHLMAREDGPVAKIAAWVEGVFRQAGDPVAAARTRPFAFGAYRVESEFPEQHHRLQQRLVQGLLEAIEAGNASGECASPEPNGDAWAIFDLTSSCMLRHVVAKSTPPPDEVRSRIDVALRIVSAKQT